MQRGSIFAITAAGLWVSAWLAMPAAAQSIDTAAARVTVGLPLHLTLRVRDFEPGPIALTRDCLQAEVQQSESGTGMQTLLWRDARRTADGDTLVALVSTQPVHEPVLRIRAALLCGPPFVREFTLLAEPPPEGLDSPRVPAAKRLANDRQLHTTPPALSVATLPADRPTRVAVSTSHTGSGAPATPAARSDTRPDTDMTATASSASLVATGPSSASPLTDAFVRLWLQDIQSVREEQRQSRAALAGMTARLERTERETWQMWAGLVAIGAGACAAAMLWRVLLDVRMRHMGRAALTEPVAGSPAVWPATELPTTTQTAAPPNPTAHVANAPASAPPAPTEVPIVATASAETPLPFALVAPEKPALHDATARWLPSEFGQAALDEDRHTDLFAKVDAMTASGHFGACVAVLENALQSRVGKSAGILLRLLDLYRSLNQPSNHGRVSVEIEAIYNVRVPPIEASDEGRSLDQHERSAQHLTQAWAREDAAAQVAQLLTRPTRIEVLDLAAFREGLLLHTMCIAHNSESASPALPALLREDADELPPLHWPAQITVA